MNELDRRTFLMRSGAAVGFHAFGLSALLAACGGDSASEESTSGATSGAAASGLTLRMPFILDMQIPDPDIMYEGEGVQVMQSVYEGLIRYVPGTNEFEPELAESWEISDDLLTYTFHLKPGVKFHDGTDADAASWVRSFERREAVAQGPAYMVEGAASLEAPDATTFVVTLGSPNVAFLHYLACPWKPFAVSPAAVEANAVGDDLAQEWLKTHDAGTGPYTITEFVPGTGYKLEAFPDWWGTAPVFTNLEISIVPDVSTQRLMLESGDVDIVTKGFGFEDLLYFQGKPDEYTTELLQTPGMIGLWLNPNSGIMADIELREAVLRAIDRESVLETTFQGTVTVTDNFFSEAQVPDGTTPFDQRFDPSILEALVPELESRTIDLAYREGGGAPYRRMAELVQTQLSALGLDVTTRAMPSSEMFALGTGPEDQRPDLLLTGWGGGDALHVDTTVRILLRTGAAPLNWFAYSNLEVDAEMDAALLEPTDEAANEHYRTISELVQADYLVLPFGRDVVGIVARHGVDNIQANSYLRYVFFAEELQTVE